MTEASKHQEALDKISAETEQLKEMSSQLPTELQALQKQLSEEKENHEKELQGATHVLPIDTSLFADCFLLAVAALSHSDRTRAQKQSSLESGHELYQKRLALKFERFQVQSHTCTLKCLLLTWNMSLPGRSRDQNAQHRS